MAKEPDYRPTEYRVIAHMITELEKLGYIVSPGRGGALSFSRVNWQDPILSEETFKWEATHMIAAQLRPDHLRIEKAPQGLGFRFTAKLLLG